MPLYQTLHNHVHASLTALQTDGILPAELDLNNVVLEQPKDAAHGDFATNAALVLAKGAGMNPRVIAEALLPKLLDHGAVATGSIAGPGFINITLEHDALISELDVLQTAGYGKIDISGGEKALVEYVSINPTGPIHVGHGRNAVFGDAIARLLEMAGYPVYREYLVNDAGGQIRVLVNSLMVRYRQLFGEDIDVPARGYPGDYLVKIAEDLKAQDGDKWLTHKDDEDFLLTELRGFAVEACLELIKADLKVMDIEFDRFFSEFDMHKTDAMKNAIAELRAKDFIFEGILPPPKGKDIVDYEPVELTLFKATAFGLPEDQPVYKRNGEPTYFGQDIAYHYDKLKRGYEKLVTVIGADQAGSFKPLAKAIEALTGREKLYTPVPYEMVKVLRNGEPVRMSKRAGNFVLLKDVLAEVGNDAFRFAMLMAKPTTIMHFDLAKAVEKSMDNPVFYVQYAHARLVNVQRQAAEQGVDMAFEIDFSVLEQEHARALLTKLTLYPLMVQRAAQSLEPHRLAFYAQEVAALIHSWYGAEKFVDADNSAQTAARMRLVLAAQSILADILAVCGVSAPDHM